MSKLVLSNGIEILVGEFVFDLAGPDTAGMAIGYVLAGDLSQDPVGPFVTALSAGKDAEARWGGTRPLGAAAICEHCGRAVEVMFQNIGHEPIVMNRVRVLYAVGTGVIAREHPIGAPPEYGAFFIAHDEVCDGGE